MLTKSKFIVFIFTTQKTIEELFEPQLKCNLYYLDKIRPVGLQIIAHNPHNVPPLIVTSKVTKIYKRF